MTDTPTIPDMHDVESSNIAAVGYHPETQTLHVKFKGGAHYSHAGVSSEAHTAFMASESKGKHYNATFKGKPEFPHTKMKTDAH